MRNFVSFIIITLCTFDLRYAGASDSEHYILLTKDKKPICRTRCLNPPEDLYAYFFFSFLNITDLCFFLVCLCLLPHCIFVLFLLKEMIAQIRYIHNVNL